MNESCEARTSVVRMLVMTCALAACTVSPRHPPHPSLAGAPASHEDTDASRQGAVQRAAAADLACSHVEIVLTFSREYANVAQPRYVVDGCGKRAVYAEACAEYPRCRYVVLSVMPIPSSSVPAAPGP